MNEGTWIKGKQKITGRWNYYRPSDRFDIWLDSKDPITGVNRHVATYGDTPEWGGWKLVRDKEAK